MAAEAPKDDGESVEDANAGSRAPPYGLQSYWEARYRSLYHSKQATSSPSHRGKGKTSNKKVNEDEYNNSRTAYLSFLDDPLPGHAWYFSYEEIQPLLLPLAEKLPSLKDSKNNGSCSILEIGCGDVPVVPELARDIAQETNLMMNAVCMDYSAPVIDYLKQKQKLEEKDGRRRKRKNNEEENSEEMRRPTKRTKTSQDDVNAPRVQVQYAVEDATKLPYQDSQFDIVLEKGALDASLSDKHGGIQRCNTMVAEAARVLRMNGAMVIVSHVNAHHPVGLGWLEEAIFPGLQKGGGMNCAWHVEVHGNSDEEVLDDDEMEEN